MLGLLLSLGRWQLGRADEKSEARVRFEAAQAEVPLSLNTVNLTGTVPTESLQFAPVTATGRYDTTRQFLLDNRTHGGKAGYHVLTPLHLGNNTAVLVNRGWVAFLGRRDELPAIAVDETPRRVSGVSALPREDQLVLGETGYEPTTSWPRTVQRIEIAAIEKTLGLSLLPVVLRLDPTTPDGFVRKWDAFVGIGPTRHHGYAFQWFSLAFALVVVYFVVATRREAPGVPVHADESAEPDEDHRSTSASAPNTRA